MIFPTGKNSSSSDKDSGSETSDEDFFFEDKATERDKEISFEDDKDSIVEEFGNMSCTPKTKQKKKATKKCLDTARAPAAVPVSFSSATIHPYCQYAYEEDNKSYINIEFIVPQLNAKHVCAVMANSKTLVLSTVVPPAIIDVNRHFVDNSGALVQDYNKHMEVRFRTAMSELKNLGGHEGVISSDYQKVPLVKDCEEEIVEILLTKCENCCSEIAQLVATRMSYHLVLFVKFKVKAKTINRFKEVGYRTPTRQNTNVNFGSNTATPAPAPAQPAQPAPPTPQQSGGSGNKRQHLDPNGPAAGSSNFLGLSMFDGGRN